MLLARRMSEGSSMGSFVACTTGLVDGSLRPRQVSESSAPSTVSAAGPALADLAAWLPRLGPILWLERCGGQALLPRDNPPVRGILLGSPVLEPLVACTGVGAHARVTTQGPREWLSFSDARGEARAKLYLLPDSDCLAWDEMVAAMGAVPVREDLPRLRGHWALLRAAVLRFGLAWRARVLRFESGQLAWLPTLNATPPLRLSLVGLDAVRAIAQEEAAQLVSPLYSPC